nr:hypothetical protein OG546_36035 [Streptomyces antimycoticus]
MAILLGMVYSGLRHVDGSGGDRGEDAVRLLPDGKRHVFQIKSFTGRLSPARRRQVRKSLDRAARNVPTCWTLVVPLDFTPGEWDWFDSLRETYPFSLECHGLRWLNSKAVENPAIGRLFQAPQSQSHVWPRVADTGPVDAGVPVAEGGEVPAYVPRDIDPVLRAWLRQTGESGGAVVILGDSVAGKTRTLYEALREELPDHCFVRPADPAEVPQLAEGIMTAAEPCVLWLDELHRYLDHGCGLIASGLRKVLRSGTTVLATLDGAAYEYWRRSDVVRQMRSLVLDRRWSVAERQRARMSQDPRVAQAAQADPAIGVAECLAAGPWLWQELRSRCLSGRDHCVSAGQA